MEWNRSIETTDPYAAISFLPEGEIVGKFKKIPPPPPSPKLDVKSIFITSLWNEGTFIYVIRKIERNICCIIER